MMITPIDHNNVGIAMAQRFGDGNSGEATTNYYDPPPFAGRIP